MKVLVLEKSINPDLLIAGLKRKMGIVIEVDKPEEVEIESCVMKNRYDCIIVDYDNINIVHQLLPASINNYVPTIMFFEGKLDDVHFAQGIFETIIKNGSTKSYRQLMWGIASALRHKRNVDTGKISSRIAL